MDSVTHLGLIIFGHFPHMRVGNNRAIFFHFGHFTLCEGEGSSPGRCQGLEWRHSRITSTNHCSDVVACALHLAAPFYFATHGHFIGWKRQT